MQPQLASRLQLAATASAPITYGAKLSEEEKTRQQAWGEKGLVSPEPQRRLRSSGSREARLASSEGEGAETPPWPPPHLCGRSCDLTLVQMLHGVLPAPPPHAVRCPASAPIPAGSPSCPHTITLFQALSLSHLISCNTFLTSLPVSKLVTP